MTQTATVAYPLSARYAAALDAYEEVLFLRDLVDRIDVAMAHQERRNGQHRLPDPYYFVVGEKETEVLFKRIWYIEVSANRLREAERALAAATERYDEAFKNATLGRHDLRPVVAGQGLPHPETVRREAADRPAFQPWWRRRRKIGFYGLGGCRILTAPPAGEKHIALNVPDPSAAIAFWRGNLR